MKKNLFIIAISLVSIVFIGWGSDGHNLINKNSVYSFPSNASYLFSWQNMLALHASDADHRKSQDPTEAPKHYIDIDNYPEFLTTGRIPQSLDSVIALYGYSFAQSQGFLPWATIAAYDSLENCLARFDWNKAILFAADLGHYVGDGTMPLHITRNYNGQYTGQNGIHSRYESGMIYTYLSQIIFSPDSAVYVENIPNFVFNHIYTSYPYVDSLLSADLSAKSFSGGSYNSTYYLRLWTLSKGFTIGILKKASTNLGSLIYTAWVNAGSPTPTDVNDPLFEVIKSFELAQNYPNPFNGTTIINYSLPISSEVQFNVFDILGNTVYSSNEGFKSSGNHSIRFNTGNDISAGVYFYQINANKYLQTKKMLLLK